MPPVGVSIPRITSAMVDLPAPKNVAPAENVEDIEAIKKSKIDTKQIAALTSAAKIKGIEPEKICRLYKVTSLADLTQAQYSNINLHWEQIKNA